MGFMELGQPPLNASWSRTPAWALGSHQELKSGDLLFPGAGGGCAGRAGGLSSGSEGAPLAGVAATLGSASLWGHRSLYKAGGGGADTALVLGYDGGSR